MLAWCRAAVVTPFGDVSVDHWAVPDVENETDDLPELDCAQDQLGSVLWNSNECVSRYLREHIFVDGAKGVRVLELGAGVGALGISLAMAGALVAITDIKELVPLMRHNIELNHITPPAACKPFAWKWGEAAPPELVAYLGCRLDVVILCDALYGNPKDWPKLITTLDWLKDEFPGCTIVNFCEQRVNAVEAGFIELLQRERNDKHSDWVSTTAEVVGSSGLDMKIQVTRFTRNNKTPSVAEAPKKKRRVEK